MSVVTVLYFAVARERAGTAAESVEFEGSTVKELLAVLAARHPSLAEVLPHLRVAVNQEFAVAQGAIPKNAEVALIPPVSGGSGRFQLQQTPLRLEDAIALVAGHAYGGLVTFVGAVRDNTKGRAVLRLEYEAYAPMAVAKLEEIALEAQAQWPGARVAVLHRVGVLSPGDSAVVIAVAAPHRKEAFRACEHVIERLKQDVPIWKKEVYADGEVWVGMGP